MKVKEILTDVATYLNMPDLLETTLFDGSKTATDEQKNIIDFLIKCCNLVVNQIATEYYTFKDKKKVSSTNGKINYSSISFYPIVDIIKVKRGGVDVKYVCHSTYLEVPVGEIEVEFAFTPSPATMVSSNIELYNYKINPRVIAYGVVAEYYYINGIYDDATIWDNRFKTSLNGIVRPKKDVIIKSRLWI